MPQQQTALLPRHDEDATCVVTIGRETRSALEEGIDFGREKENATSALLTDYSLKNCAKQESLRAVLQP